MSAFRESLGGSEIIVSKADVTEAADFFMSPARASLHVAIHAEDMAPPAVRDHSRASKFCSHWLVLRRPPNGKK